MIEAPATPPATPAPTTPAEAPGAKPSPGTPQLAEYYAKQAMKAKLADDMSAAAAMESAKADQPAAENEPERGADGKFRPKDGKTAAKPVSEAKPKVPTTTEAGSSGAEAAEQAEPAAVGAGLGKARKHVREGEIAKALELIGLHPDKLEGKQWGAFRQREKAAADAERQAQQMKQELQQVARQLEHQYGRYEQAKRALEAEDYDTAFKLAFDMDANDYQRKRIAAMTTKDPKVAQLEKRLREFEQQRSQELDQLKAKQSDADRAQAQQAYKAKLASDLADGDERLARVAKKPAFIQKVFDIQQQHWNDRTGETIDTIEAAELAWEELYDGVAGSPSATAAPTASKPAGAAKTPVRQAAKAATTLNPHEAAEAAPAPKLAPGSKELRDYYVRKAELAQAGVTSG